MQQDAQKKTGNQKRRKQNTENLQCDAGPDDPCPVRKDIQFLDNPAAFLIRCLAKVLQKHTGTVDDPPKAIGHTQQDQTDTRDQDHGADSQLQGGNQIVQGHGPVHFLTVDHSGPFYCEQIQDFIVLAVTL